MGGANEICTDKTGTLTCNVMKVQEFYAEETSHDNLESVSLTTQDLILVGCSTNSNSYLLKDPVSSAIQRVGNQTECSLLQFVNDSLKLIQNPSSQRSSTSSLLTYDSIRSHQKVIKTIPFNSETKKMTVVIETEPDKKVRIYTKGASENIIDDCIAYFDKSHTECEIDLSKREAIKDTILKNMA